MLDILWISTVGVQPGNVFPAYRARQSFLVVLQPKFMIVIIEQKLIIQEEIKT
jgi:hypothetical protein